MIHVYEKIAKYFAEEYQGQDEKASSLAMTVEDLRELAYLKVEHQRVETELKKAQEVIAHFHLQSTKENRETIQELLSGNWVDSEKVQAALGMTFAECFRLFDFSRTAEWWSLVGKTEEERKREGQKVMCKFRLKRADRWIPVSEGLPKEKGWYQCTCFNEEIWGANSIVRDLCFYPEIQEFVDSIRYESNGFKNREKYFWTKYVTAWQPLPEAYQGR